MTVVRKLAALKLRVIRSIIIYNIRLNILTGNIAARQPIINLLRRSNRRVMFDDPSYGENLTLQLLQGHDTRIFNTTRLQKHQFRALHTWLQEHTTLAAGRRTSSQQKLMIFLWICGTGGSHRGASEHFHRSTSIIAGIFHEVLQVMVVLHKYWVKMPQDGDPTPDRIQQNNKLWPYFADAVGAIDGTHIPICIKGRDRPQSLSHVPWRNRKGWLSQNVLAAVDFDMNFCFIHAGWEGSAHDSKVLKDAVRGHGFKAPPGKYWLADAGYNGWDDLCLTPYSRVRYHLKEWAGSNCKPQTAKELFNLRHAGARNVVERVFGVFKARFKIFTTVHDGYSIRTQKQLVYALTGLHNFINAYGADPEIEWEENLKNPGRSRELDNGGTDEGVVSLLESQKLVKRREDISSEMWKAYLEYLVVINGRGGGDDVVDRAEN